MYSTWKRINFYLQHQELKIENSSNTIMTALAVCYYKIINTLMSWKMSIAVFVNRIKHNIKLILN